MATGLFVVLLCKASGWSSTTAKADKVAGLFSFAFASWFSPLVFVWFFGVTCSTPLEKLLITPHTSKNQLKTARYHEATTLRTHTAGNRNIQPQYEFCLNESGQQYFSDNHLQEYSISGRPQRKEFSSKDPIRQTPQ